MRLWQPLTELRERLRACPIWVLVLAAPLYLVVFIGCLISLPLLLPLWLLDPLLGPFVEPIVRSRAVEWMATKRIEDFPVQVAAWAGLFNWDVTRAGDLLQRVRSFRRVLLVFIIGQWAMLVAVGSLRGLSLLWPLPDLAYLAAIPCAVVLVLAAILSTIGLSYYHRLYQCCMTSTCPRVADAATSAKIGSPPGAPSVEVLSRRSCQVVCQHAMNSGSP